MLSPSFRCRFGDDAADGYVRGEGVGAAGVLDACYGDFSGDGAAARGGVALIEAHGTGTRLGDPVELGALGSAKLGGDATLRCGSAKTNVGHLEGVSGLAGLLKAALVVASTDNIAPRSLHFCRPNAHVPWDALRVRVLQLPDAFSGDAAATVGVSSFGFGGALGHGAAYAGMGRALYGADAAFAAAFDAALDAVGRHGGDVALGREAPDAVVGHSLGEVAAFASRASSRSAARLVVGSGAAMGALAPGVGAMAAVRAGVDRVREVLGDDAPVACDNSPLGCSLGGAAAAVDAAVARLDAAGVASTRLRVATGFHSACARRPVAFAAALRRLDADAADTVVVEVGPAAHLAPHVAALGASAVATLGGARDAGGEPRAVLKALGGLALGADLAVAATSARLPPTAFAGQPCWFEATQAPAAPPRPRRAPSPARASCAAAPSPSPAARAPWGSRSRRISCAAARAVLLSRSGAVRSADEPLREALLAAAEEKRATVDVVALDVCDGGAVAPRAPELRGLVHGAGVVDDGALRSRTRDTLRRALDPKLGGALRLATAVDAARDAQGCPPLALEVYLSSITALLGNAGQSDYGAASAALDALAASRRRKHGPRAAALVSVQWGPWAGFGMAAKARDGGGGTRARPSCRWNPATPARSSTTRCGAPRRSAGPGADAVAAVAFAEDHLAAARRASPLLDRLAARLRGRAGVDASLHDGAANVGDAVLRIFHAHSRGRGHHGGDALPALGLDSLEVMAIVRDVNQATGAALGVADVLGAPTLGDVVDAALKRRSRRRRRWRASSRPSGTTRRRGRRGRRHARRGAGPRLAGSGGARRRRTLGAELTVVDVLDGRCLADLAGACADEAPAAAAAPAPPAKEKRETPEADARRSTRLLFTLLSYALGAQLLLLGFLPCYACERYAPGRLALGPKLRLLERLVRFAFVAVDVLPARAAPARAWVGGDVAPGRTLAFSAEAAAAGCLYVFLWALGCHAAAVLCKWLLVGHQRPGVFPTWTSSAGYRAALLANAHAASRPDLWGAALAIYRTAASPAPRALGAGVGSDAGAHVGDGAVVCAGAGLDGPLPRGSYATSRGVERPRPGEEKPPGACDTTIRVPAPPRRDGGEAARGRGDLLLDLAPLASFALLGPCVVAAAISPLVHAVFLLAAKPPLTYGLVSFAALAAAWAVSGPAVGAVAVARVMRCLLLGDVRSQLRRTVPLTPSFVARHAVVDAWGRAADAAASRLVKYSGAMNAVWRALGLRVGARGAILSELLGNHALLGSSTGALFALLNVTLLAADVVPSWWARRRLRAVARPLGPAGRRGGGGGARAAGRRRGRLLNGWLGAGAALAADGVLVVLFAAVAVGRAFLFGLVHVGAKQVLLGEARDDGVAHALRGPRHVAWAATLVVGRLPGFPKPARFLFEAQRAYLRALGATVGDNVRIFPEPEVVQALPEADVVSYGAGALFSAHVYGHDFSNMHLKFRDTSVGEHCEALDAWQAQVLPGTHLPRGTRLKTLGRAIVFPGIVAEPDGDWAGNPVQRV
ncbi:hypothetical protein JL720_7330 [Aureococcus anophagefferens]|nr:hypothetical protein JL720_7330 [Aureococcus anophagefferens]